MITGRARLVGENVSVSDILSNVHLAEHMASGAGLPALVPRLFETVKPGYGATIEKGDILVAGGYFGYGSTGEIIPRTLIAAGISCIIARSFSRTFYRAGINLGILPIECAVEAAEQDAIEIDPEQGVLTVNRGRAYSFQKLPPMLLDIMSDEGLLGYYRKHGTI
jgi:3-isopropylmalate dehydratase small subunit